MSEVNHPNDMPLMKGVMSKHKFNRCVEFFEDNPSSPSLKCDVNSNTSKRGRKPVTTTNTVKGIMCQYSSLRDIPTTVLDVLEGVARLDWYSRADAMRKNVVAPNPIIEHSFVRPWNRVLIKCDVNSKWLVRKGFTVNKPNDYGEWFLSPAGVTRKEYLLLLNQTGNNTDQLSVNRMVRVLKTLPEISSKEVSHILGVGKRQAERYNKACKIAMPFLERSFQTHYEMMVERLRKKYRRMVKDEATPEGEENWIQYMFDSMAINSVGGPLSSYYHEDIAGIYVPFVGVVLENFTSALPEDCEDIEDVDIDDYLLAGDV